MLLVFCEQLHHILGTLTGYKKLYRIYSASNNPSDKLSGAASIGGPLA